MNIYEKLSNVMYGFPPDQPVEMPMVVALVAAHKSMLTERDCEVALLCELLPEPVEAIAARAGIDCEAMEEDLQQALKHGIVMCEYLDKEKKKLGYYRAGLLPGIAETYTAQKCTKEAAYWYDTFCGGQMQDSMPNMAFGRGGMRVIPVREAVAPGTKVLKYDEITPYLDEVDVYAVANCACKNARKTLGQGCGHPTEVCIQLGKTAESFILAGLARQITREEAEHILKDCERRGLVHQVTVAEKGKSIMMCNCCACSCIILRAASMLNLAAPSRSNFKPVVDEEKCVGCGACVDNCSMNAMRLGSKHAKDAPVLLDLPDPFYTDWTEDLWDKDSTNRKLVTSQGTSPCKTYCPAHISVQGYIKKAGQGKYDEALKVIKRDNPFPAVCGRICPHDCENHCTRAKIDESVAIDDIKKFIADKELDAGNLYVPEIYDHYTEKVAVIGGGPAGLTAAYYLAEEGYPVTVFERNAAPGGMLKFGIPSFRLEKDVIDAEISVLEKLGVEFRCGVNVGSDVTLDELRQQGFKAFYVAIGAQDARKLNVEGEDLQGVISGIRFLRQVNEGRLDAIEGDTVVIGGGNVAVDVARAAMRLGNRNVKMVCLEKDEEMPTVPDEKDEAIAEGIQICNSWGPVRILGSEGRVTGVEFRRCVSVYDEEGRFAPVFDDSQTVVMPCSNVFLAIGQAMDWGALLEHSKAVVGPGGVVKVAEISYQTDEPDIFAGGDCATGPKFTIDAIATGKSAAISIDRFLRGNDLFKNRGGEFRAFDKENADLSGFDRMARQRPHHAAASKALETMGDTRTTLTEEQLQKETQRCLGCGVAVLEPAKCIGCGNCYVKCEFDAIELTRIADIEPPDTPEEYMQIAGAYAMQRAANLAAKGAQATGGDATSFDHFKGGRKGE
jgi:NADPH-dependent glutamate synthase beta subunit-like oxidoreductase/NAD-dependent dihydropyrimidine dehydrogenase PreA subunit